jgi:hypothetical protein
MVLLWPVTAPGAKAQPHASKGVQNIDWNTTAVATEGHALPALTITKHIQKPAADAGAALATALS